MSSTAIVVDIVVALIAIRLVLGVVNLAGLALKIGIITAVLVGIFGTAGLSHAIGNLKQFQNQLRGTLGKGSIRVDSGTGIVSSQSFAAIAQNIAKQIKLPDDSVTVIATCKDGVQTVVTHYKEPSAPLGTGLIKTVTITVPDSGQCKVIASTIDQVKKKLAEVPK